jgi:O-antigen ligase
MVVGMLMAFNLRNFKGVFFVLAFSTIFIPFFAEDIYNQMLQPLVEKEINVVEGEKSIETLGNGRMTRWEKYFEIWQQMPVLNQMIGVSFSGFKDAFVMMGLGMHSDYVRNLFLSGIIGLTLYLLFMIAMTIKAFAMKNLADKFLVLCTVLTIYLYSLTTMPTLYAPYLYLLYCVYAYALLPREKQF